MVMIDQGVARPMMSRNTTLSKGAPTRLEISMRCENGRLVKVNSAQSPSSPMAKAAALARASCGVAMYQLTMQPTSMAHSTLCPTRRCA